MGHYNTVKAGDPFRPSAKLENEVRKFFNGGATVSGQSGKNSVANNNRIYVKNISEENKIPAYSAVAITEKDGVFYADLAADANGFWGIAIETISPLSSGSVVVAGVVSAFVSATGSGDFVAPGADGKLIRTSSSRGQLLYAGDAEKPGIILLGAGGGGGEYNGYFKIIAVPVVDDEGQPTGQVKIAAVNGTSYNPATGETEGNLCKINSMYWGITEHLISDTIDTAGSQHLCVLLEMTHPDKIFALKLRPLDDMQLVYDSYYTSTSVLGEVIISDGAVSIKQLCFGVPQLLWFAGCEPLQQEKGGNTDANSSNA